MPAYRYCTTYICRKRSPRSLSVPHPRSTQHAQACVELNAGGGTDMAADQGQWPWEALPAAPSRRPSAEAAKRRRWEVGQQPLVLPTDSGNYVLLEVPSPRAAPAASSLPSPVVLSDGPPLVQRRPSSAPSEDPASGPSNLPRQHSPRARPASQEHAARARTPGTSQSGACRPDSCPRRSPRSARTGDRQRRRT